MTYLLYSKVHDVTIEALVCIFSVNDLDKSDEKFANKCNFCSIAIL